MLLPSLVGNSLLISFAFGGVGAGLAWIAFSFWPRLAPIDGALLGLALTWIPFGLACMLLQNLLLGIQEVRAYNKVELISNIGNVILIGLLFIFGVISVVSVFSVGLVALILTLCWALWRLRTQFTSMPKVSSALFKDNIVYGFKAYLAALFSFLVLRVDLLMVKYMLDAEQAGYYSIAAAMADMVYMLPVVTGTILFPKLSAMTDATTKWQFTGRLASRLTLVMFFVAGFAALLAKPMLGLLYGEEFLPAVPAFIWLLPGIVMLSINTILLNYFAAIGMPPITVYSPVIAVIINIILNLKLIPSLGIVGASISSVVAYGIMLIASTVFIYMESKKLNE
jgi:O-antigen/teichoic acid export membrane protein